MAGVKAPRPKGPAALPRRQVLALIAGAGLAGLAPLPALPQTGSAASLGMVLDVLFPADDMSPAATTLGIDRDIAEFAATNPQLQRLFDLALAWLDQSEGQPFAALTADARAKALERMERSDFNQVPGRFFHILRALAAEFYYARPESLAGLSLNPAPQPLGYPPPWG